MSDKDKPLSAADNKARMEKGLAAGKTFYLRGGKKLRGRKADVGDVKSSPPASPPKADAGPADKPYKSDKASEKSSDRAKG